MHLKEITLTHFKNYDIQKLEAGPFLNCLTGLNGMGKTNLLDAIYYLCMCKSNFNLDRDTRQFGKEFFRVEGHFVRKNKDEKIVCKVIPGKKKVFEANDVAYKKLSEHIGLFPVVMIRPGDTSLALEGSEDRRRFLDNTLCQLDVIYLNHLITYNKILKQRNIYLKSIPYGSRPNEQLLKTYDLQLLEPAKYIQVRRREGLEELRPIFNQYYARISGGAEQVDCQYQSKVDENFEAQLEAVRMKDLQLRRTTVGIHKDDLIFKLNDYNLKKTGSQGQLKSYILSIKLAQYEYIRQHKEVKPILLLDDIFDKLDANRVRQLLELLLENDFGQIFLTDTHESRTTEIADSLERDYKKFHVEKGRIEEK